MCRSPTAAPQQAGWCSPLSGGAVASELTCCVRAYVRHARMSLPPACCRFFRRVTSFSSALPSDSPHQRIVRATRSYLIGRGPLMCPWAFATQSESHRRPHTDNRAARHGFWKVTLRIAKNGSSPISGAQPNVHASKWTEEHA